MSEEENPTPNTPFSPDQQRLVDRIAADARREGARTAEQKLIGSLGERFDRLEAKIAAPVAASAPEPVRPATAPMAPNPIGHRTVSGIASVFALTPNQIDELGAETVRSMFEAEVNVLRAGRPKPPSHKRRG